MSTDTNKLKLAEEKNSRKELIGKLGPLLALIVLVIFVTILNPGFVAPTNLLNLLRQVSTNALIAFGMTYLLVQH